MVRLFNFFFSKPIEALVWKESSYFSHNLCQMLQMKERINENMTAYGNYNEVCNCYRQNYFFYMHPNDLTFLTEILNVNFWM